MDPPMAVGNTPISLARSALIASLKKRSRTVYWMITGEFRRIATERVRIVLGSEEMRVL